MLLLGLLQEPDGEVGRIVGGFGITREEALGRAENLWRPSCEGNGKAPPRLSPLCRNILRRASRKASWRREREITTGRILLVFLRGLSGGDARILQVRRVGRRRARRAIRHEIKVRRIMRITFEGGGPLLSASESAGRFNLATFPPRRFASLRSRRSRANCACAMRPKRSHLGRGKHAKRRRRPTTHQLPNGQPQLTPSCHLERS